MRHWRDARSVFAQPGRMSHAQLLAAAERVEQLSAGYDEAGDRELLAAASETRSALTRAARLRGAQADEQRLQAMAVIAAIAARFIGMRPRREQIFAALAMQEGHAVDLPPGHGKTLAVACCAVLHTWSARRCHVVVASEQCAKRDAHALGRFYAMTDCSVGWLEGNAAPERAAEVYGCDIVYATGRRLLSDHVHDRSVLGNSASPLRRQIWSMRQHEDGKQLLMGELAAAVIDDIDRVLLDEALSPLVIGASGDGAILDAATRSAATLVDRLQPERDYRIGFLPGADVAFTESGHALLEKLARELPPFWRHLRRAEDVLVNAVIARDVLEEGKHYAVREGRVHPASDGLQALLGGRAWHMGVLQAVEARAGLELSAPPRTIARASFQEFFPLYRHLSGTGVMLADLAPELLRFYRQRTLQATAADHGKPRRHVSATLTEKHSAIVDRVLDLHRQDAPVIVLAASITEMEAVVSPLSAAGVAAEAVLGMQPEQDALRLRQAGQPGGVTVMTLGALRGASIDVSRAAGASGGLHILSCGQQDLRRLDELIAALPGTVEFFISLDDDLLADAAPLWARPLRWFAAWPTGRNAALILLARIVQRRTLGQLARHRLLLLKREEQFDLQLAFSRKS